MPSRFVFRCEVCDSEPDEETQRTLTSQLAELRSGEYVNAPPAAAVPPVWALLRRRLSATAARR